MAKDTSPKRPLSPHLTIYRPQWTSGTSIFVRITGNAMLVAGLLIVWWFMAAAAGPDAFATADGFLTSWFGDLVMFLSMAGLWYHLLGGVRHLIWDQGYLLEIDKAETFGQAIVVISVLLAIFTAIVI